MYFSKNLLCTLSSRLGKYLSKKLIKNLGRGHADWICTSPPPLSVQSCVAREIVSIGGGTRPIKRGKKRLPDGATRRDAHPVRPVSVPFLIQSILTRSLSLFFPALALLTLLPFAIGNRSLRLVLRYFPTFSLSSRSMIKPQTNANYRRENRWERVCENPDVCVHVARRNKNEKNLAEE